jgi:hypothetical protein
VESIEHLEPYSPAHTNALYRNIKKLEGDLRKVREERDVFRKEAVSLSITRCNLREQLRKAEIKIDLLQNGTTPQDLEEMIELVGRLHDLTHKDY